MKKVVYAVALLLFPVMAQAQDFESYKAKKLAEFAKYSKEKKEELDAYRQKLNEEYADYMRKRWSEFETYRAMPVPNRPEPPAPVVKDPDKKPLDKPEPLIADTPPAAPVDTPMPELTVPPQTIPVDKPVDVPPAEPADKPVEPSVSYLDFEFYGTPCKVVGDISYRFTLSEVSNNGIADAWQKLSSQKYYALVDELIELRNELNLCDWGYVSLAEEFAKSLMGENRMNEARVLQMFILTQSGYKARMAQSNGTVFLLLPFDGNIDVYTYPFITRDGYRYYLLDKEHIGEQISVFDKEFPNERFCSLEMGKLPALRNTSEYTRTYQSKLYYDTNATLTINKNIVDFYNDYPITSEWDMYVRTSISYTVREQLYPQLRKAIASKSKIEAADILLNFVQTAFEYKVDQEQFGNERPLFAEETLYYPFCDCEDRSIFYAILVRELLGLDVVLLNYPTHLATAVCFGEDISGSYIDYKGKRFFVCDPTYIGASVGEAMPDLENNITIVEI